MYKRFYLCRRHREKDIILSRSPMPLCAEPTSAGLPKRRDAAALIGFHHEVGIGRDAEGDEGF